MRDELSELLEIAKHAASLGAAVHWRAMEAGKFNVETKRSTFDLVTEIDREADYECGLGRWDITAAAAIAEAAGAEILLLNSSVLPNPFLVAANSKLMSAMVALLIETGMAEAPHQLAR